MTRSLCTSKTSIITHIIIKKLVYYVPQKTVGFRYRFVVFIKTNYSYYNIIVTCHITHTTIVSLDSSTSITYFVCVSNFYLVLIFSINNVDVQTLQNSSDNTRLCVYIIIIPFLNLFFLKLRGNRSR